MKKATDKLPVTRILIDYQEELMSRIHAYFHPQNEDPDLFLVRLLRKSENEEIATKILKAKRNYYTWSFAFTVTFDCDGAITRVKETLDYFGFFKIDIPKMPQRIFDAFPVLGEYYQSIISVKSSI